MHGYKDLWLQPTLNDLGGTPNWPLVLISASASRGTISALGQPIVHTFSNEHAVYRYPGGMDYTPSTPVKPGSVKISYVVANVDGVTSRGTITVSVRR